MIEVLLNLLTLSSLYHRDPFWRGSRIFPISFFFSFKQT
nr:MAG TPA: hypothetical protein [Caudoviricetes sp.]